MQKAPRLAFLVVVWAAALCAVDFAALTPQGYVSDFSGVIPPAVRAELNSYAKKVDAATGVEMAFVTLPTLAGEPVEDVANLLFRKWGVGKKGKDEGILLLLVTGDRRSRLEVGYGLEPIIPDGYAGSLLREMRPALRAGQYGDAMSIAARRIAERVAAEKRIALDSAPPPRPRAQPRPHIPWFVLFGGAGLVIWLLTMRGPRQRGHGGYIPDLILGNMIGHTLGRGWSRGGFGGYDSGDSFGGFGGGDSGGGGASSDW